MLNIPIDLVILNYGAGIVIAINMIIQGLECQLNDPFQYNFFLYIGTYLGISTPPNSY